MREPAASCVAAGSLTLASARDGGRALGMLDGELGLACEWPRAYLTVNPL